MGKIVRYESEHGDVLVEVNEELESELQRVADKRGEKVTEKVVNAAESFEDAVEPVLANCKAMLDRIGSLKPDKAEVQFGVNLGGEFGVVAKVTGEANFTLTLTWEFDQPTK
jgi:predicted lysophospholipase L1 biosynthesis ABC-type transport system permease subunit